MPIVKQDRVMPFHALHRGAPFAFTTTIYSKSEGKEDSKEHLFYKQNGNRATTLDKRVVVYFAPEDKVILCKLEHKQVS